MTITTKTLQLIRDLQAVNTAKKALSEKHITKRQAFFESAINDIQALSNGKNLKAVATEYLRELGLELGDDLKNEQDIIKYVALNSNIPNDVKYGVAVKLKRFEPTNSRLNKAKDLAVLVKELQAEYNTAIVAKHAKFVTAIGGKDLDTLTEYLDIVKLTITALKAEAKK